LQPYFPEGKFKFDQLPFNLANQRGQAAYNLTAPLLSTSLAHFSKVLLFLTSHSEEDRGDLFIGKDEGVLVASKVSEVSDHLHP
ncbi:hypothetical protein ID866_9753, partial [Astraeus odoratus]